MNLLTLKYLVNAFLRPNGKYYFLRTLKNNSKILDVGCGNSSVARVKSLLPKCDYTGIDVGDYNQTDYSKNLMDSYLIFEPNKFSSGIRALGQNTFDVVISSHNIEHCDDPYTTLLEMLYVLKPGGSIYLSFPCSKSINFPSRYGTLNYFDDDTHKANPPDFDLISNKLSAAGFEITFATRQYKPFLLFFIGFILEFFSNKQKKVFIGTWEFYGFESIIHAKKTDSIN
jgi:SAM-dependent methyltransferase